MILYQLRCERNHEFEAWFKGSAGFEAQNRRAEVECPFCGTTKVAKAPMAPSVVGGREAEPGRSQETRELATRVVDAVRKLRRHVEENCDYVGDAFPEEARRIHYGEKSARGMEKNARGIYGEATSDEARRLDEEGIEVFRLPRTPRRDG
jgi:hypothetical protein